MPGPLTHLYIARTLKKDATPEFLIANCLPDIEHLVYGEEKMLSIMKKGKYHFWNKRIIKQFPELKEGISLHMEADKLLHKSYIEPRSALIAKQVNSNPLVVHPIFEFCMEVCLARKKPWLRRLYKKIVMEVNIKVISKKLAQIFKKEGSYMDKTLKDANRIILTKDYSVILKLLKIKWVVGKYLKGHMNKALKPTNKQYIKIILASMKIARRDSVQAVERLIQEMSY